MYKELQDINHVPLPPIQSSTYLQKVPIYELKCNNPNPVQIDFIFHGGRVQELKKLLALATHTLIKDCPKQFAGKKISKLFDAFGAQLTFQSYLDGSVISVKCLARFVFQLLPPLIKILLEPDFKESDLNLFVDKQKQELNIDLNYNESLAHRYLTEKLFGLDHPYGYNTSNELLESLTIQDLNRFHLEIYRQDNCSILIMAQESNKIKELIFTQLIEQLPKVSKRRPENLHFESEKGSFIYKNHLGPQWSIKLGCTAVSRGHEKFASWTLMNYILGGFYGSRLVKTIREELGLTYDISTHLDTLRYGSIFTIHTEVSPPNKQKILDRIKLEIELLCKLPVKPSELRMVKNYTMGGYLRLLDGPLRQMQMLKSLLLEGYDFNTLSNTFQQIKEIDSESLLYDFQTFIDFESLCKIMVR